MKVIFIENYRGWNINLDKDNGCFFSSYNNEFNNEFNNESYKGIKKQIDNYIEANNTFKVFEVEILPSIWDENKKFKVIGINHKMNKFQLENAKGEKFFVCDSAEKEYVLLNENNENVKKEYFELIKQEKELSNKKAEIYKKYIIKTLKDIKGNYL